MRLLAINGSHKKVGGINQLLIDKLFEGAIESGAECETIRLSKYNINPCIACNYCQEQNEYKCIYDEKDDFIKIITKIKHSDIIIYSTPIYIFQMSSKMKAFLERYYSRGKSNIKTLSHSHLFFHDIEKELCAKPFVSIIISDNFEKKTTENVKLYFETFSKFMDAPNVGCLIRNGCFIFKNESINERQKNMINDILLNLKKAGKCLVENGYIPKKIESSISRNVLPVPSLIFNILKRFKFGKVKLLEKSKL